MVETFKSAIAAIGSLAPTDVALIVFFYATMILFSALRWRAVLQVLGHSSRLSDMVSGLLCSVFTNNVTPFRVGGDVLRVAWVKKRSGLDVKQAAASVGLDRVADLIPAAFVGLLSLDVLRRLLGPLDSWPLLLGIGVAGAMLFLWLLRRPAIQARLRQVRDQLSVPTPHRGRKIALVVLYSNLAWLQDFIRLILAARAFGVDLGVTEVASLVVVTIVGQLMPTFGGVGAVEGGMTGALVWFGVPSETALAIVLTERSVSYVLSTLVGGLFMLALGGRRAWAAMRGSVDDPAE